MGSVKATREDLEKLLTSLNVEYRVVEHRETPKLQDLKEVMEEAAETDGVLGLNLAMKCQKTGQLVLAALSQPGDSKLYKNMVKTLRPADTSSPPPPALKELRMLKDPEPIEYLNIVPGALNPFLLMNDDKKRFLFLVDERLADSKKIWFHPFANTASLCLPFDGLLKFCEASKVPVYFFSAESDGDASPQPNGTVSGGQAKGGAETGGASKKGDDEPEAITASKAADFAEWYIQIVRKAELMEYTDISGCYVVRSRAVHIWHLIQQQFNEALDEMGIKQEYYPMFVSQEALQKEADNFEGFAPEVAWLGSYGPEPYDHRNPNCKGKPLQQGIAIRPTSETIMYPIWAKWVRSFRDLPILRNQWCNIVRWEFKQPTPFIRTREFWWQEGHTAHANDEEALSMMWSILEEYKGLYEDLLAVPVIKGLKSEGEKFPGGKITSTVETLMPNGRAVQAATSHHLGTQFAEIYGIRFFDKDATSRDSTKVAHQTSWGYTTRSIGVMVMVHSDDRGLVLPPKVAIEQAVFIPIKPPKEEDEKYRQMLDKIEELKNQLKVTRFSDFPLPDEPKEKRPFSNKLRIIVDARNDKTAGWKYNEYELKGVPLRIELGPKDFEKKQVVIVRRDTREKVFASWDELPQKVCHTLRKMQRDLLQKATENFYSNIALVTKKEEMYAALNSRKIFLAPWCLHESTEDEIKDDTAAQAASAGTGQAAVENTEESQATGGLPAMTGGAKPLCWLPQDSPYLTRLLEKHCPDRLTKNGDVLPKGTPCFWGASHTPSDEILKEWFSKSVVTPVLKIFDHFAQGSAIPFSSGSQAQGTPAAGEESTSQKSKMWSMARFEEELNALFHPPITASSETVPSPPARPEALEKDARRLAQKMFDDLSEYQKGERATRDSSGETDKTKMLREKCQQLATQAKDELKKNAESSMFDAWKKMELEQRKIAKVWALFGRSY